MSQSRPGWEKSLLRRGNSKHESPDGEMSQERFENWKRTPCGGNTISLKDEVRDGKRGLVDHGEEIGFYSQCNQKPLKRP